jgi:RNA polymerase sigma factor (sigma-70 family)
MAARSQPLLDHVRRLAARLDPEADVVLLERFVHQRDSAAFEALVHRHGAMVLGVCRRLLGNDHDAEDVFQATFLVLARKAAGGHPPDSLPAWLHGTAHRLALKHRQTQKRRQNRETRSAQTAETAQSPDPFDQLTVREMFQALDEELQRLPEINRLPLILCYLEGRTQDEAAEMLGWTPGSVRGRLQRGRALLHARLARRGLAMGMGLLAAAALGQGIAMALPPGLARATVEAALRFAAGGNVGVAAGVMTLAEGALRRTGLKIVTVLFGVALAVSAGAVLARQIGAREEATPRPHIDEPMPAAETPSGPERGNRAAAPMDCFDDPLPAEALARMGTTRLRHMECVNSVFFAPDGKMIVSGGTDDTLRLWDAATAKLVRSLKHPDRIQRGRPLSFAGDGKTLISATVFTNQLWLWDLRTSERPRKVELKREQNQPFDVRAISSDGKTAASSDKEGGIQLWNVADGNPVRVLQGHGKPIRSLSFSPNNQTLASTAHGDAKEVRLWDVATGKLLHKLEHPPLVGTVSFSPDGKILASGGGEQGPFKPEGNPSAIRLWDAATGKLLRILEGHQRPLLTSSFSPDGKILASGSFDQTIRLWDVTTGKELRKLKGPQHLVQSLSFSPDSKVLAVGGSGPAVRLWDVATGEELQRPGRVHTGQVHSVAFSPDGRMLATAAARGEGDGTVRLWDAASGKPLRRLQHPGEAHSVAFAPDGKTLASGGADAVCLWDVTTGERLRQLESQGGSPLAFSPDGKLLAPGPYRAGFAPSGTTLRLWDATTGTLLRAPALEHSHVTLSAAFSPDGKVLAVRTMSSLHLWGAVTGQELLKLGIKWDMRAALSFSPDGKTLAVGDASGKIHLLEAATGNKIHTLTGHLKPIVSLAFSPSGRRLASGSLDRTVRLWEVHTGSASSCRQFRGHEGPVTSVAFSPDGRRLTSGSEDSTALVWDVAGLTARQSRGAPRATREELTACWRSLLSTDSAQAYQAMRRLAAGPEQAVPFLAGRLQEQDRQRSDPQQVARLLAELDSADFHVRSRAAKELEKWAEAVEPALRQALQDNPSLEVRRHLQQLLEAMYPDGVSLHLLRRLRALEVLEWIDNPAARELLKKLAADSSREKVAQEAKAALGRLHARPNP